MLPSPKPTQMTPTDFARIAKSIKTAAEIGRSLKASGLNRRAIIVLLQDATKCSVKDIKLILDALPQLDALYTLLP